MSMDNCDLNIDQNTPGSRFGLGAQSACPVPIRGNTPRQQGTV